MLRKLGDLLIYVNAPLELQIFRQADENSGIPKFRNFRIEVGVDIAADTVTFRDKKLELRGACRLLDDPSGPAPLLSFVFLFPPLVLLKPLDLLVQAVNLRRA